MRIIENTPDRLVLSNAPPALASAFIVILILFGALFLWPNVNTLGWFTWVMAILWTGFGVLLFRLHAWTTAILDAETGTLQLRYSGILGRRGAATLDLRGISKLTWDEIDVWSRLATSHRDLETMSRDLIVRRDSGQGYGRIRGNPRGDGAAQEISTMLRRIGGDAPQA
jgi:hypothetical protein